MASETGPVGLGPDLLLELQRGGEQALHTQLESALRDHIRSGRLAPGMRLPSSRGLATQLGLSRGVVVETYAQLTAEGYLTSSQGSRTRVAPLPAVERPPVPAGTLGPPAALRLDPLTPDLALFPIREWARSQRAALKQAPFASLGYGDPRGSPALRNELMAYLGRVRGALPEPEHTLVCTGFSQAFAALCRTLRDRGVDRIGIEDPGWGRHRLIAAGSGLEPVAIPVDEQGVDVSTLAAAECEVVVATPAHQFPTGVVLSSARRAALLEWAEEEDGLIVEDDYDSELRYDRGAVGALQGLSPERVCHIGSVSARLAPGLRLGWVLAPSWLSGALTFEQGLTADAPSTPDQLALADFVARGELDRHLRRVRLVYRRRREALAAGLATELPQVTVTGVAAGLFLFGRLPEGIDPEAVSRAMAARGVEVEVSGGGLVIGYAGQSEGTLARCVRLLAESVCEAQEMDLGLRDRACVITGASRGIGRATALMLAREGASLLLVGRDQAALDELARECGGAARSLALDVTDPDAGDQLVQASLEAFDRVDVLVNNAGTTQVRSLDELTDQDWEDQWQLHVMAPMRAMRAAAPVMAERGFGRIVNVSSSSGKRPGQRNIAYSVTKAAVLSLSRAFADAYAGQGLLINAVTPGPIGTELWLGPGGLADQSVDAQGTSRDQVLEKVAAGVPLGRLGTEDEVAAVITFLCSEQASYVTGAAWSVDGGIVPVII